MKPKAFFYLLSGITLLLLLGGGYLYIVAASKVTSSNKKLAQTMAEIQVASEKGLLLAKLSNEYENDVKQLLPQIDNTLPNEKEQSDLARQLQSVAASSGVRLGAIAFSPSVVPSPTSQTTAAGDLLALPATFSTESTYSALQTFLQRLENFPRQSNVTSVVVGRSSGSSVTGQFKVSFYLKP